MKYELRIMFEGIVRRCQSHHKPEGVKLNYFKIIFNAQIAEPTGSLDAENVRGLKGKFSGDASDLDIRFLTRYQY
jgi:hypothetical protein